MEVRYIKTNLLSENWSNNGTAINPSTFWSGKPPVPVAESFACESSGLNQGYLNYRQLGRVAFFEKSARWIWYRKVNSGPA